VLRHRRLQPARREAAEQLCGYMARQARTAASRRSFRHSECQERVGPCQPIRRTRRLVAVIRIDDARLLTLAADGPGNKRVPGARRLGGRSILANGVNRRSGLQLAVGQFKTGSSSSTSRIGLSTFEPIRDRRWNPRPRPSKLHMPAVRTQFHRGLVARPLRP
jgi:hypothetical protein